MAMAAGIEGLTLMENAGRGCVQVLRDHGIQSAVICTGAGNNAGDGFVIARLLSEAGIPVKIIMTCRPERLVGDALSNYQRVRQLSLPTMQLDERCEDSTIRSALETVDGIHTDWIVDALLGTGASGNPRPPMDRLIRLTNACPARKLAVDIPSGLDCETGQPGDPTLQAELTCTFVTPKIGFRQVSATKYLGHVHVIDIGVPPGIVADIARGADSDGTHHAG